MLAVFNVRANEAPDFRVVSMRIRTPGPGAIWKVGVLMCDLTELYVSIEQHVSLRI
jgi:hypothetical protein